MFRHGRNFGLRLGTSKALGVLAVAGVVATGSYAFTASNTVAASPVGEAESATISGYTTSNTVWTIDPVDATKIQKVEFDMDTVTAATKTYAGADNGTTIGWSSLCSQGSITAGSAHETCTFSSEPNVADITKLAVSAVN
ncbi:MAG TPA: hypothetical protein VGQ38_14060 [Gaiellaceae bacterium]|jgi:hypothetical protein|nr:hypothetical protein [Gaiellaceae bacterium]